MHAPPPSFDVAQDRLFSPVAGEDEGGKNSNDNFEIHEQFGYRHGVPPFEIDSYVICSPMSNLAA
jgi:hypothetical protein